MKIQIDDNNKIIFIKQQYRYMPMNDYLNKVLSGYKLKNQNKIIVFNRYLNRSF